MRPERMLSAAEALEILKNGAYGVLSTVLPDGAPYGVPVNYYYDTEENAIYFHCAIKGQKLDAIRHEGRVSFAVVQSARIMPELLTTHYGSAIATGTATLITDAAEKTVCLRRLCEVLAPNVVERREDTIPKYLPGCAVVRIQVAQVTGKRNRDT